MKIEAVLISILSILITTCNEPQPEGDITILENGSYFDGTQFVPFSEIIIRDSIIEAISREQSEIKGERIDVTGKYIIPGLTDAHVHLFCCPGIQNVSFDDYKVNAATCLKSGVTTVVDLASIKTEFRQFRYEVNTNPKQYTTCLMSGPAIRIGSNPEYSNEILVTTIAQATGLVNELIDNNADIIKVIYKQGADNNLLLLQTVVATAHKLNRKVAAHINSNKEAADCIKTGVDVLAHLPRDSMDATIFKSSHITVIPTMSIVKAYYEGFDKEYLADSLLWNTADTSAMSNINPDRPNIPPSADSSFAALYRYNLNTCIDNKIPIIAGTDACSPIVFFGYSLHDEIKQYTFAGMSNAEAINAATKNAEYLFPNIRTGSLKEGYYADLVILNKNPLADISNTKFIDIVIHKGYFVNR